MGAVLVWAASSDDTAQGAHDASGRELPIRPRHSPITSSALTDAELVVRIQQNDGPALGELTRQYFPRLNTVAYAILGADDLAQDVVQEAFIALWEQRARLDPAANVAGYLSRMVRNRSLNLLQHERAEFRAAQTFATTTDAPSRTAPNAAEASLSRADINARVYAALRQVPPSPRQVFLLYWEHDLTYAEIAATLGITVINVRQQMRRATQRLASLLLKEERG